jgi:hypothetical protein
MSDQEREALIELTTEERLALGLRISAAGINDLGTTLAGLEGPDMGGDNTLRRLNQASFIGEHYGRGLREDWITLLGHVRRLEAALAAREEPQEFILPARFSRDDLQSDQAFHAAEEVLTGTFGEPSPEEAHADLYGQIIDAVCDDLAAREDTERPTVRHHEELQRAYEEALGRANRAEKSLREDIERPGITEYVTTREWKPELGRDQSLGDAIEEAIADGILVVRDPEQEPEQ